MAGCETLKNTFWQSLPYASRFSSASGIGMSFGNIECFSGISRMEQPLQALILSYLTHQKISPP